MVRNGTNLKHIKFFQILISENESFPGNVVFADILSTISSLF